jgi:esterase/lipase
MPDQDLSNKRILLLHGLTSSPRVFDSLVEKFNKSTFNCFAPHLTGHRNNPPNSKEVSLSNYLSELDEYVNYVSHGGRLRFTILGVSFGSLLALTVLKRHPHLVESIILISPPMEFRNLGTRVILPLLKYIPASIAKYLGSLPKHITTRKQVVKDSYYTLNELVVFSKLRDSVLQTKLHFPRPSLLIQSSFDHHINPYSLYYLRNKILGDKARIVLRDWGAEHSLVENEDASLVISNFLSQIYA